jgi:hypothetical protein
MPSTAIEPEGKDRHDRHCSSESPAARPATPGQVPCGGLATRFQGRAFGRRGGHPGGHRLRATGRLQSVDRPLCLDPADDRLCARRHLAPVDHWSRRRDLRHDRRRGGAAGGGQQWDVPFIHHCPDAAHRGLLRCGELFAARWSGRFSRPADPRGPAQWCLDLDHDWPVGQGARQQAGSNAILSPGTRNPRARPQGTLADRSPVAGQRGGDAADAAPVEARAGVADDHDPCRSGGLSAAAGSDGRGADRPGGQRSAGPRVARPAAARSRRPGRFGRRSGAGAVYQRHAHRAQLRRTQRLRYRCGP